MYQTSKVFVHKSQRLLNCQKVIFKLHLRELSIFALIEKIVVVIISVCYSACVEVRGDAGAGSLLPL